MSLRVLHEERLQRESQKITLMEVLTSAELLKLRSPRLLQLSVDSHARAGCSKAQVSNRTIDTTSRLQTILEVPSLATRLARSMDVLADQAFIGNQTPVYLLHTSTRSDDILILR